MMSKTVLFFPGQASQYVGMGRDLYESSEEVRNLYKIASDEMNLDLPRLSFEGPVEELKRTRITQPAILVHSLAVLTVLGDRLPEFDFAAGHSLGEYGALAVTGALSFEDAIKAVVTRAHLMEDACQAKPGTMAAIVGLDEGQIDAICKAASAKGIVVPANFNSASQIAISGDMAGIEEATRLAREAGAKRAIVLEVGGAFHSPLMEPARDGLSQYLKGITFNTPAKPVVANVTGYAVTEGTQIRDLLVKQVTAPVRWAQTMSYLVDQGVTTVVEIGPGKVLTGLAKRDMRPEHMETLDRIEDIESSTVTV